MQQKIDKETLRKMILDGDDITNVDYSDIDNMDGLLQNSDIEYIPDSFDMSKVTSAKNMFSGCHKLKIIPNLDTSNLRYMDFMFYNCPELKVIPALNTAKVESMRKIFDYCDSIETIQRPSDWYLYDWDSALSPDDSKLKNKYPQLYDKTLRTKD